MGQLLVDSYSFGEIVIDGKRYSRDLVITPSRIYTNWWRLEGHRLQIKDVQEFLSKKAEYVIIGTGYYGLMRVDPDVVEAFRNRGMEVIILNSREAVEKYNELVKAGKKVMLLIHLTC